MAHSVSAFLSLYVFWLLLSGYFTPFLMIAGAGCAAAVVLFTRRMQVLDREGQPLQLVLRSLPYWRWLLVEILKSGWAVSLIIVHPRLPISPTLVRFKPSQKTAVGLVTHANSITLTPGTITVEADADEFVVHALTRAAAQGALSGEMDARVLALEADR
ncbi:MAG: Na+/H+ antiporter subunit E [Rubrivivax sp.]|nr:Na+/H+ antiporter subunit E [Rubrivivax sp.]